MWKTTIVDLSQTLLFVLSAAAMLYTFIYYFHMRVCVCVCVCLYVCVCTTYWGVLNCVHSIVVIPMHHQQHQPCPTVAQLIVFLHRCPIAHCSFRWRCHCYSPLITNRSLQLLYSIKQTNSLSTWRIIEWLSNMTGYNEWINQSIRMFYSGLKVSYTAIPQSHCQGLRNDSSQGHDKIDETNQFSVFNVQ